MTPKQFKEYLETLLNVSVSVHKLPKRYRYTITYNITDNSPTYTINYEIFSTKVSKSSALDIFTDITQNMIYHLREDKYND